MNQEFSYPPGLYVQLQMKLNNTEQGRKFPEATKSFLEAMRPILWNAKTFNDMRVRTAPGARQDLLEKCHKKFSNLLTFMSQLPADVRTEIDSGIREIESLNRLKIESLETNESELSEESLNELRAAQRQEEALKLNLDDLKNLLSNAVDASQLRQRSIDKRVEGKFGKTYYRLIFLEDIVNQFIAAYGEPPNHTYNRKKVPTHSKTKGFHGVAHEMCKLVGFPANGIEQVLADILKPSPVRTTENKSD